MGKRSNQGRTSHHIAASVRHRIERGGERVWRLDDFRDLPFTAVAQTLSRLTRAGTLERLSKGTYYQPRDTVFGRSRPNPATIQKLASRNKAIFPSGIAAANLLGFSTQSAKQGEVSTTALSLPRKLMGGATIIHARRPEAWRQLSQEDGALLDFLRRGGKTSELSPEQTARKTIRMLRDKGRFERLLNVARTEPPRVRAVLGAIGEELGKRRTVLDRLRQSLNPFSKYDFGLLAGLRHAKRWQVKTGPIA
jgi:hypothetical protein